MSKGYAKRYFYSLGQFYASTRVPVRPFMHWPQWARDAYRDGLGYGPRTSQSQNFVEPK